MWCYKCDGLRGYYKTIHKIIRFKSRSHNLQELIDCVVYFRNFHEVEQPASNQYTEVSWYVYINIKLLLWKTYDFMSDSFHLFSQLQSTSKSQQQQTDEENRVDVEEAASMQHSGIAVK